MNIPIRFAVCDDEKFMLDEISVQLSAYMEEKKLPYRLEGFLDGERLLESGGEFDVIFLDIQMTPPDGMETAAALRERGYEGLIIFITVLKELVFASFEVGAYDYLVKPMEPGRFSRTMDRVLKTLGEREERREEHIIVKERQYYQTVSVPDIVYCEVLGRKVYLHLKNGETVSYYERLSHLEQEMDGCFFRCHRSYLVNLDYVKGRRQGAVLLMTGGEVPVSRLRENAFAQALLSHMKERRHG